MAFDNLYITAQDFKNFQRTDSIDLTDDEVITAIIAQASRQIDDVTGRHFYPLVQTRLYDIPGVDFTDRDEISLDDDLLELITLTNGDLTVITNAQYILRSVNSPPYWAVKLRDSANITWEQNSANSSQQVLSVAGVWGWHNAYARAWLLIGTLSAAVTTTTSLSLSLPVGHGVVVGNLIKIDNEYFNVATVGATSATVIRRGDNGTTAATHLISAPIYQWQTVNSVQAACQLITDDYYKRRFGNSDNAAATITAMGVVLTPKDIPAAAWRLLQPLMRQA